MNIACIIHSLDGGGAERVMASLASRLAARQHSVTLITLDDGTRRRHEVEPAVVQRQLDLMFESRGIAAKFFNTRHRVHRLRAAIRREAPDVVLSFCDRTNILTLLAARTLGIPVVISERSDPTQQTLGAAWEFLRDRAYRQADAIVALTQDAATYLGNRYRMSVRVIPSAVDRPPFSSDRTSATDQRRILGIGRLENEKGFDRLIEAYAAVVAKSPQWSLRILGEGSMRASLEGQIRDRGLTGQVTMPGWVQPVWSELAGSTIFALPSRYEGFPSALLEAMAVGIPSIAVDCASGPRAILTDPSLGLLVPNNVSALADGLGKLVEDAEWRERLGQAGKVVVDRFGWDVMVDAYEEVLRQTLSSTKRKA